MIGGFYLLVLIVLGLAALVITYSMRNVTGPNYGPDDHGLWTAAIAVAIGIGIVYVRGWFTGHNYIAELSTLREFVALIEQTRDKE